MRNKSEFTLLGAALFLLFTCINNSWGQIKQDDPFKQEVSIEWSNGKPSGTIEVSNGSLGKIEIIKGKSNSFKFSSSGQSRIKLEINNIKNESGPGATLISIKTSSSPFHSF